MLSEIEGQLERVTYHNDSNHYTVARMRVKGKRDLVTVVGSMVSATPGEVLKLRGSWENHPKFGEQFKIVSYESVVPATAKGIERYLGSGLIKGIGPVMAKRLVEKFGAATLDIIEKETGRLREVEGIGDKRVSMIRTAWEEQKEVRDVMLFLQGHEVSSSYAAKIYKQYGSDSIRVVRENPYKLAEDIFGIGFLTADRIADKLGVAKDSPLRAEAGIMYALQKNSEEGHVYYPYGQLIQQCTEILDVGREIIVRAFEKITTEKKTVVEDTAGGTDESRAVFLAAYHAAETGAAKNLRALFETPKIYSQPDMEDVLRWAWKELKITLEGKQAEAVQEALGKKALVITGGPGTGKTTIIRVITGIYRRMGLRVLLAAPTGRAAKRLSEASGVDAKTIHRLLEFSPRIGGFKKNDESPLEADLVVIDEVSMVDILLMYHLLKAVPKNATLILVGDVDQLPSVGAGNVLKDIIESGIIPTVKLKEIFRQSRESLIITNAHKINSGDFPVLTSKREIAQDFYFIDIEEPEKVCEMLIHLCKDRIPQRFGFDAVGDIQVLAPMHRGIAGASNLNAELQKNLNPSTDEFVRGGRVFRRGDKVMQIRNNYDRDVYNGDIGRIMSIDREEQSVAVDYDGKKVFYDFIDLDEIVLAYAVSVHKSQGSEYPVVLMPLLTQHYMMLQRNLLYTAITRGKKLVVIVGTKKALAIAIMNNKPQLRYTRLKERLRAENGIMP